MGRSIPKTRATASHEFVSSRDAVTPLTVMSDTSNLVLLLAGAVIFLSLAIAPVPGTHLKREAMSTAESRDLRLEMPSGTAAARFLIFAVGLTGGSDRRRYPEQSERDRRRHSLQTAR